MDSIFLSPVQYFRQCGSRPRKRFGQHFLAQSNTAENIVRSADLMASDSVVEVGPGLGALTHFIIPQVDRLDLVELDRDLAEYLTTAVQPLENRVTVHCMDVLGFDFAGLSRQVGARLTVLGNLPYNISSPLMFRLLENLPFLDRAVFMVQKEVGERFAAGPGNGDYGVLSVLLGIFGRVSRLFTVGPGQFYPPPKVESLVVRIDFMERTEPDFPGFSRIRSLVNAAFRQRRKTLRNGLKGFGGLDSPGAEEAFRAAGIDAGRRAETLSPEEFVALTKAFRSAAQQSESDRQDFEVKPD